MDRYQRVEKPRPEPAAINENEIRITSQGLIRNYLSYANSLLQERRLREIVLKAMGQAISKAVAIAELIKKRNPHLHQDISISSVSITDVWEPIEEGLVPYSYMFLSPPCPVPPCPVQVGDDTPCFNDFNNFVNQRAHQENPRNHMDVDVVEVEEGSGEEEQHMVGMADMATIRVVMVDMATIKEDMVVTAIIKVDMVTMEIIKKMVDGIQIGIEVVGVVGEVGTLMVQVMEEEEDLVAEGPEAEVMAVYKGGWVAVGEGTIFIISGGLVNGQMVTFHLSNKCPFPVWPAAAPIAGHPVIADGGFLLPPNQTKRVHAPPTWNGRFWGRTGCDFTTTSKPACQTGDCQGLLSCNGTIGTPPATLVEVALQEDQSKPSFYDVSVVDGYNLPIAVSTKPAYRKCWIGGCTKSINSVCPQELQVLDHSGAAVVACKSACLAFDLDVFCCRNSYGKPETCKPSMYSAMFKDACPSYFSYAYDAPPPLMNCYSREYVIIFCPSRWGSLLSQ
ncbi:Thaumatin family [Musa troglodytarum]|uniref:Thaumatin family n=1 Tax=Musa troglodytarum TaxID=320322 RepID=A0A9E7HDS7_9LILI|nr:Thaumatin family [Musa troglodytarum]